MSSRARRISAYLREMFPLALYVPSGFVSFATIHLTLQSLAGVAPPRVTWRFLPGSLTIVLFMLLLRVFDELKDLDTDLALAASGDPRFATRPIVAGRVLPEDLQFLVRVVVALLVLLNLPLGVLPLAGFGLAGLGVWLSRHWFFWPAVKGNLILALITHNPLSLLVSGYVVALYAREHAVLTPFTVPLLVGLWLPVTAWETSRKIRLPEEETSYQTYSKVLGLRAAIALPALLVMGSAVCLSSLVRPAGLGLLGAAIVSIAALAMVGACLRALVWPSIPSVRLRPFAEAYGVAANLGLLISVVWAHGVALA